MSEHIMGIEIGNSNIKMIEVSRKAAMMIVHRFSMIETPPECINNGAIINTEALRKVISDEMAAKKFKAKKVVSVIQSSSILIRNIIIDKQPDKIIKEILNVKLEEYMPVERSQYQVDYKILREFEEEEKEKYELSLVAAPNSIVLPLASLLKSLKLVPILINIGSESIGNVFAGPKRLVFDSSDGVLVLDIGGMSTNATIVAGNNAVLSRYIDFGVKHIHEALEDAERNKSILDKSSESEDTIDKIRPQIEYNIISEVERILQFYYSNLNLGMIKKVYLIGGGAGIKGLRGYVRDALNIPTEKLVEFNTVSSGKGVEFEGYGRFFANILGTINGL